MADITSPDLTRFCQGLLSTNSTSSDIKRQTDLANDIYRTAALGFFIHKEGVKTDAILRKDGQKAIAYTKDPDGLFSIKMSMPDGTTEHWKQTDLMMDAKTGTKIMAYERRNADNSVYIGANGKPQAIINCVGTISTEEDIKTMRDLVKGNTGQDIFAKASDYVGVWADHAKKRADSNGLSMPDVVAGSHSYGAYFVGAVALKLNDLGLNAPTRTVEIEPVGAGAGLRQLAQAGNATPAVAEGRAAIIAKNAVSLRAPSTIFHHEGGALTHANRIVGETYEYASASQGALGSMMAVMEDHSLALPANDLNKYGFAGLKRTADRDTPITKFLNDTPLNSSAQLLAEAGTEVFAVYSRAMRGNEEFGDIHTAPTDLHEKNIPKRGAPVSSQALCK